MSLMCRAAWIHKLRSSVLLLPITLIFLLVIAVSCTSEDIFTLEQRAFVLDTQILCPICDGQSIAESNAQIAQDLRQIVREQLAAGATNSEVLDFVTDRYGEGIVGSPDAGNFWGLLAWLAPGIIAFIGVVILGIVLFSIKRRTALPIQTAPTQASSSAPSTKYTAMVERELTARLANKDNKEEESE